jgi:hypothetical protein
MYLPKVENKAIEILQNVMRQQEGTLWYNIYI